MIISKSLHLVFLQQACEDFKRKIRNKYWERKRNKLANLLLMVGILKSSDVGVPVFLSFSIEFLQPLKLHAACNVSYISIYTFLLINMQTQFSVLCTL